jgi:hypothetical protein
MDNLSAVSDTLSSNGSSASNSSTLKQRNVELIVPALAFFDLLTFTAFIFRAPSFNNGIFSSD